MEGLQSENLSAWAEEMKTMYRQLQIESLTYALPAIFCLGMGVLFVSIQNIDLSMAGVVVGFGLILLAAAGWYLVRVSYRAASWGLVAGLGLAVLLAAGWGRMGEALFLICVPVGLATLTLGGVPGMAVAAGGSLLLWLAPLEWLPATPGIKTAALVGMWIMVGLIWLTLRPLLNSVQWSWAGYRKSTELLEQARDFQGQLQQSLGDLKEANGQLTRLNRLAQGLRQVAEDERRIKEEFVANVSHELRTPLNMIVGFCSMILKSPETYGDAIPPVLLADLEVVLRNSTHLASLIDDILDLSQIDAGRMALTKERANLSEIIDEAVIAVRPLYQSKNLYINLEVPSGADPAAGAHTGAPLPAVWCDRTRIREVLLNLLSNAGRFTDAGGVTIRARKENRNVVVSVGDTGMGISEEDKSRLFRPFQQLDGTIRRRVGGTGLGLSISKGFIELHDGKMWVESEKGKGTTFFFQLPIDPIAPPQAGPERWMSPYQPRDERVRRPGPPAAAVHPRLVVVEKSGTLRKLLTRYLQNTEIAAFAGLDAALEDLNTTPARALLVNELDIRPLLETLRQPQQLPYGVPAILCTIPGGAQASTSLGVNQYLVKPVSREALLQALQNLDRPVETILLVDDEPDARQLFRRILASAPQEYRVLRAANGAEALELLRQQPVDVILLDLMMPEMDGFQLLERKNQVEELRGIPVILISALDPQGQPIVSNLLAVTRGGGISMQQVLASIEALSAILGPIDWPAAPVPPETPPG